jgi:hypothetical protein
MSMTTTRGQQRGEAAPIEVRVGELRQLYNSIDPAPFRERDLDPQAEEFIVESARELGHSAPLSLVVHLTRPLGMPEQVEVLRQAVREYFAQRAASTRAQVRRLFREGRWALLIGLAFVAAANVVGDFAGELVGRQQYGRFLHESVVIGAWVALWRPLQIFLYDWWPLLADARLFDRLSAMAVDVRSGQEESSS